MKNFHKTDPATQPSSPLLHPDSLWLKFDPRNHSASLCYAGVVLGPCTHRLEEGQNSRRLVSLLLAEGVKGDNWGSRQKKKKVNWASRYKNVLTTSFRARGRGGGKFIWKSDIVPNLHFRFSCPSQHFSRPEMLSCATTLEGPSVQRGTSNSTSSNLPHISGLCTVRVNTVTPRQLWKVK